MNDLRHQFLKYVSLNILAMIGNSCYILADTFFIANGCGSLSLAALNIALPVYSFVSGIGQMISVGAATKYTILKAQGEDQEANRLFTDAFRLCLLIGICCMLLITFYGRTICRLLGADATILELTTTYLRTMMIFAPFFVTNILLGAFVRNDGAPGLSMTSVLAGSLFNVVFDYIFIYPMDLGLWGAALATGCAPVIGILINMIHIIRKKNQFHFIGSLLQPIRLSSLTISCRLGISAFIAEFSNGVVLLAYNRLMLPLAGNNGVAAYGVVANIALVVIAIFSGVTMGMQPLISEQYGRDNQKATRQLIRYGLLLTSILALGITAAGFLAAEPMVDAFNQEGNQEMAALAVPGLRLYFTGFLFAGINMILSSAYAAMEQAGRAFLISISRGLILIVPAAILMTICFGLNGLWLAFTVTEVIVVCASMVANVRP